MRKIKEKDLLNKKITKVDIPASNVINLTFDDGTSLNIWAGTSWVGSGNLPILETDEE